MDGGLPPVRIPDSCVCHESCPAAEEAIASLLGRCPTGAWRTHFEPHASLSPGAADLLDLIRKSPGISVAGLLGQIEVDALEAAYAFGIPAPTVCDLLDHVLPILDDLVRQRHVRHCQTTWKLYGL